MRIIPNHKIEQPATLWSSDYKITRRRNGLYRFTLRQRIGASTQFQVVESEAKYGSSNDARIAATELANEGPVMVVLGKDSAPLERGTYMHCSAYVRACSELGVDCHIADPMVLAYTEQRREPLASVLNYVNTRLGR